jgi:hypothetical protein
MLHAACNPELGGISLPETIVKCVISNTTSKGRGARAVLYRNMYVDTRDIGIIEYGMIVNIVTSVLMSEVDRLHNLSGRAGGQAANIMTKQKMSTAAERMVVDEISKLEKKGDLVVAMINPTDDTLEVWLRHKDVSFREPAGRMPL